MKSYKRWSPDIAKEEKYKRKREREDDYVHNFRPQDRPVLLIKNKHAFKGINNPDIFDDEIDKECYFKITQNTQECEDLNSEIMTQSGMIKKHTVFHPVNKNLLAEQK